MIYHLYLFPSTYFAHHLGKIRSLCSSSPLHTQSEKMLTLLFFSLGVLLLLGLLFKFVLFDGNNSDDFLSGCDQN